METFLQQNGWIGFVIYIAWKELFPFVRDRIYPENMKRINAERDRLKKLEERTVQNDERQTLVVESMRDSVHEMAMVIATNNERLSQLIVDHNNHARFMQDSVAIMRERSAESSNMRRRVDDQKE
jgi:hypothetical protein